MDLVSFQLQAPAKFNLHHSEITIAYSNFSLENLNKWFHLSRIPENSPLLTTGSTNILPFILIVLQNDIDTNLPMISAALSICWSLTGPSENRPKMCDSETNFLPIFAKLLSFAQQTSNDELIDSILICLQNLSNLPVVQSSLTEGETNCLSIFLGFLKSDLNLDEILRLISSYCRSSHHLSRTLDVCLKVIYDNDNKAKMIDGQTNFFHRFVELLKNEILNADLSLTKTLLLCLQNLTTWKSNLSTSNGESDLIIILIGSLKLDSLSSVHVNVLGTLRNLSLAPQNVQQMLQLNLTRHLLPFLRKSLDEQSKVHLFVLLDKICTLAPNELTNHLSGISFVMFEVLSQLPTDPSTWPVNTDCWGTESYYGLLTFALMKASRFEIISTLLETVGAEPFFTSLLTSTSSSEKEKVKAAVTLSFIIGKREHSAGSLLEQKPEVLPSLVKILRNMVRGVSSTDGLGSTWLFGTISILLSAFNSLSISDTNNKIISESEVTNCLLNILADFLKSNSPGYVDCFDTYYGGGCKDRESAILAIRILSRMSFLFETDEGEDEAEEEENKKITFCKYLLNNSKCFGLRCSVCDHHLSHQEFPNGNWICDHQAHSVGSKTGLTELYGCSTFRQCNWGVCVPCYEAHTSETKEVYLSPIGIFEDALIKARVEQWNDPETLQSIEHLIRCFKPHSPSLPSVIPDSISRRSNPFVSEEKSHVFVSYCWHETARPDLVRSSVALMKKQGIDVWIDVEGSSLLGPMSGSTDDMMGTAIDLATVAIIFVSEKYKESPNCRQEALYINNLKKRGKLQVVYVMTSQNYHTASSPNYCDGWLGVMIGDSLWIPMWDRSLVDEAIGKILSHLEPKLHRTEAKKIILPSLSTPVTPKSALISNVDSSSDLSGMESELNGLREENARLRTGMMEIQSKLAILLG